MAAPMQPEDGYYYPTTEDQIVDLVCYASANNLQLRVHGSGHSIPEASFTDDSIAPISKTTSVRAGKTKPKAQTADGISLPNINVKLSKYHNILEYNDALKIVKVEAGIHLYQDPEDPYSTEENSLLYWLSNKGWALPDLGGITHQTVSGFLSTGSAGGSLHHDAKDGVQAMEIVDGTGRVFSVSARDPNTDLFHAALVSMGLLGVVSTVTFKCSENFNICGQQTCTVMDEGPVDIFDDTPPAGSEQMGLSTFLDQNDYSRMLWLPQKNTLLGIYGRLQVWHANRVDPADDFVRVPFTLFKNVNEMMLYSFLMTLLGNIQDMDKVNEIMDGMRSRFVELSKQEIKDNNPDIPDSDAEQQAEDNAENMYRMIGIITALVKAFPYPNVLDKLLPMFSTVAISILAPLDKDNQPGINFTDTWWQGLPMDNQADDVLVPTTFTEIWVPLRMATKATKALKRYFDPFDLTPHKTNYENTGKNAWELYASKPSSAWLSMSYSNGSDEWQEGAFRIDPLWFVENADDPRAFFRPVWVLLKKNSIPFRLHWGKIFPSMDDTAEYDWPMILVEDQYSKLNDFLTFRCSKDPNGIFLTQYWRHWLRID